MCVMRERPHCIKIDCVFPMQHTFSLLIVVSKMIARWKVVLFIFSLLLRLYLRL